MNINNHMIIVITVGIVPALSACADDQNGTSNSSIMHENLKQKIKRLLG
jgi:hypothetical protein